MSSVPKGLNQAASGFRPPSSYPNIFAGRRDLNLTGKSDTFEGAILWGESVMATTRSFFSRARRAAAFMRHLLVVGMLMAALLFVEVFTGCETEDEEPGGVLYGPPPADVDASGETSADAVVPDLVDGGPNEDIAVLYGPVQTDVIEDSLPDTNPEEEMSVLYGPPPVDVVEDATPDNDPNEEMSVLYGPPPVDVVEDSAPELDADEEISVLYGPPIGDVTEPEDESVMPDVDDEMPAVYYGPQPVDTVDEKEDCVPATLYGPPPCESDEDCKEWYGGDNWYCDTENAVANRCARSGAWPICNEQE